jgi:hypothetical protein
VKPVNRYHTKVAPAGPDWHQRNRQLVRRWDRGHWQLVFAALGRRAR